MTPDKIKAARRMYEARDMTVDQIAGVLGVSRGTVYRHLTPGGGVEQSDGSAQGST